METTAIHRLGLLLAWSFVSMISAVEPRAPGKPSTSIEKPKGGSPGNSSPSVITKNPPIPEISGEDLQDEEIIAEKKEAADTARVARPVSSDPVQVYGWQEKIKVGNMVDTMVAKLDTGATTSSLHAENQQIFERDGKKWVKFVLTDPSSADSKRYEMEAPLVRTVLIKEPGGESMRRCVVRLTFQIGERSIKAEFTLSNRNNMTCPVLIGRSTIQVLGWVDPGRTYLADDKILR
ncbi:MAG: hypothetical protein RLZZ553_587 [Verrucomicrobiota bacterium]|jgi:hypothetical protein